ASTLGSVRSVQLGRNVHVNLHSDSEFGTESTCGGLWRRLAFSTPSLRALAEHHQDESVADQVDSIAVFSPSDRAAHARFEGSFAFYSTSALPFCSSADGETLTLTRDLQMWTGSAAVYEGSFTPPYTIAFEYLSAHVGDDKGDGISVWFGKDAS